MSEHRLDPARGRSRDRIKAMLFAIGAAVFAGFAWYSVVTAIRSQVTYISIVVAVAISLAAVRGAGRGGADIAVITLVVVIVALLTCFYYVDRFGLIRTAASNRILLTIPLDPSIGWVKLVLREGFKRTPSQYVYSVIALVSSTSYAYRGGR